MNIKQILFNILFLGFCVFLFATGQIEIPKSAQLGDFITVKFKPSKKINSASIILYGKDEKPMQTVKAFQINKKEWAAIVGIPVWAQTGTTSVKAVLKYEKKTEEKNISFEIKDKQFDEYTMLLGSKNTDLIYSKSTQKDIQRNRLNEILKTNNSKNIFFHKKFILPFEIKRISSAFAEKRISKYANGNTSTSRHWGIDYPAPTGTPIKAPGDGKIVLAENRVLTGWTIVIEHLPAVYTLYYHLNKIYVEENTFVKMGDVIGEVGTTGFSTGPHLHWELRINEIPCNPEQLITQDIF